MLQKGSVLTARQTRSAMQWRILVMAVFASAFLVGSFSPLAHAQGTLATKTTVSVEKVATAAGLPTSDLYSLIGRVINIGLGLVGLVLVGYLLYAGWLWMTAGGETEKTEKALTMIRNAVIGLVILAASFAIVSFILSRLSEIAGYGNGEESTQTGLVRLPSRAGALGLGPIEYHLPARDATGVPRNTSIIITFKIPIRLSSIIQGYDDAGTPEDLSDDHPTTDLNTSAFKIFRRDSGTSGGIMLTSNQVEVHFTDDRKTFVIRPKEWLGSPTVNTPYRIDLPPGLSGLLVENNLPANRRTSIFGPEYPDGYSWQFEVSTLVDNTPPQVISVVPSLGVSPPNTVIQINFSEAVDPTSASGIFRSGRGFSNLEIAAAPTGGGSTSRVEGQFRIANHYTTVEFTAFEECGRNACGREIYCLPRSSAIDLLVKAATLSASPPQARPVTTLLGTIWDGVVDVSANSLDGNRADGAQGPPTDNFHASFSTDREADLRAPRIRSTSPPVGNASFPTGSSLIPIDQEPRAVFGLEDTSPASNILRASTVNSTNISLERQNEPAGVTSDTFWFTPFMVLLDRLENPLPPGEALYGRVAISHRSYLPLAPTVAGAPAPLAPIYAPVLTSGLENLLQNCFKPSGSLTCTATNREPFCCDGRPSAEACPFVPPRP